MKPEVKEKWLAALRSGEYQKAQGRLRGQGAGFCCLGVLCDLAAKEGVGKWSQNGSGVWLFEVPGSKTQEAVMPVGVVEWAGLSMDSVSDKHSDNDVDGQNPRLPLNPYGGSLAGYNDQVSTTFEDVAAVIDARF